MLRRDAPVKKGHREVAAGMRRRCIEEFIVRKMFLLSWIMVEEFKA